MSDTIHFIPRNLLAQFLKDPVAIRSFETLQKTVPITQTLAEGTQVLAEGTEASVAAILAGSMWPVGSIYTSILATNPATSLGFGTWSAFAAGRVLVGLDDGQVEFDTPEETGGAKTHTLISAEMPTHTHVQNAHDHGLDIEYAADTTVTGAGVRVTDIENSTGGGGTAVTVTGNQSTATNQNAGGNGAHNNLQPYIVVYMWKRTA